MLRVRADPERMRELAGLRAADPVRYLPEPQGQGSRRRRRGGGREEGGRRRGGAGRRQDQGGEPGVGCAR
jgi:hypothetical protein